MTGQVFVTNALAEIGFLGAGQTASSEDSAFALATFQRMLNGWGAERLTILALLRTTKTLVSGTRDYTIGSGGTINIVRPLWIDHATIILDNTATDPLELPVRIYTDAEWANLGLKTYDAASIEGIYYDHAFSTSTSRGTISTYPTINISIAQLVLYTPQATVGYSTLAEDLTFAPGYEEALHYNLALRLCRPYGRPIDPDLKEMADVTLSRIKTANVRLDDRQVATPWTVAPYNILTDANQ